MSVKEMLLSISVLVMAFSAARSTCLIGSPPAPIPKFGCGWFKVFKKGVICLRRLFLISTRMDAHRVCFIAESVLRLSIPLLMIKPLLGEQGACREKGYVHQLPVDYRVGASKPAF
jgi:hypothetical protein